MKNVECVVSPDGSGASCLDGLDWERGCMKRGYKSTWVTRVGNYAFSDSGQTEWKRVKRQWRRLNGGAISSWQIGEFFSMRKLEAIRKAEEKETARKKKLEKEEHRKWREQVNLKRAEAERIRKEKERELDGIFAKGRDASSRREQELAQWKAEATHVFTWNAHDYFVKLEGDQVVAFFGSRWRCVDGQWGQMVTVEGDTLGLIAGDGKLTELAKPAV